MTSEETERINQAPEARIEKNTTVSAKTHHPSVTLRGNSYDLTALLTLVIGAVVLLMCVTLGQFVYCLPFIGIVLGIIGLVMAKDAVNPNQTRLLSWLGIGGSGATLLLGLLMIFAYIACILFAMLMSWNNY